MTFLWNDPQKKIKSLYTVCQMGEPNLLGDVSPATPVWHEILRDSVVPQPAPTHEIASDIAPS